MASQRRQRLRQHFRVEHTTTWKWLPHAYRTNGARVRQSLLVRFATHGLTLVVAAGLVFTVTLSTLFFAIGTMIPTIKFVDYLLAIVVNRPATIAAITADLRIASAALCLLTTFVASVCAGAVCWINRSRVHAAIAAISASRPRRSVS